MKRRGGRLLLVVGVAACLAWLGGQAAGADPEVRAGGGADRSVLGPCDADIAFGELVACTIATPGAEKSLTFPGAGRGQGARPRDQGERALEPLAEIKRPNGTAVCAFTFSDDFTCVLDTAGTHTVHVKDNAGTNTGDFSLTIQRLNNPVGCLTLNYGNPGLTGSINAAAEMDCFSHASVAVNDVLRVRLVETTGILSGTIEVVRPDGTTLCPASPVTEVTCTADTAGTYRIVVHDSSGTSTGTYAILLQRLNNPVGCTTIVYGDPALAASIDAAAETDCFRFSGANADQARIRVVKTTGTVDPLTEVIRPDGTTICAATFSDDFTCVLNTGGMHTILIRDANGPNTGGYTVKVDKL
jgi:hypothetical protein